MKKKSYADENVFFEQIRDTPISYLKNLDLQSFLQLDGYIYFFFRGWKVNEKRRSYVGFYLRTERTTPFRMMDEQMANASVWKYRSSGKIPKNSSCIYKLWGTPYIEEMNRSGVFSNYNSKNDNKVFQVMIITGDETIELIMPKMSWEKYNPNKIKDTIIRLTKNL